MSVEVVNERDLEVIRRVYESDDPASEITHELFIDGIDRSDLVQSVSAGREGDQEPGQVLDASVALPLSRRAKGNELVWNVVVGGVPIQRFKGKVLTARYRSGFTQITGVTGGYHNGNVQLGEDLEFVKERPDNVLWEGILRNEAYDHSETEIEPIDLPLITRSNFDTDAGENEASGFDKRDKVGDLLQSVGEEVQVFHRDNFRNGYNARKDIGPARLTEIVAQFFVGSDIDPEEFEWSPTEEEYSLVQAIRELEDGEIEVVAEAQIMDSVAPARVAYEIVVSLQTTDEEAFMQVSDTVDRLQEANGGMFELQFPLKFVEATVEDGDLVIVVQPDIDGPNIVIRRWIAEVRTQKPAFEEDAAGKQDFTCRAIIGFEEIIEGPRVDEEEEAQSRGLPFLVLPDDTVLIDRDMAFIEVLEDGVEIDLDIALNYGLVVDVFAAYIEIPV